MTHQLFDIWEEKDVAFPWRAQLVNYVGQFRSRPAAESFVESTRKCREDSAKAVK